MGAKVNECQRVCAYMRSCVCVCSTACGGWGGAARVGTVQRLSRGFIDVANPVTCRPCAVMRTTSWTATSMCRPFTGRCALACCHDGCELVA